MAALGRGEDRFNAAWKSIDVALTERFGLSPPPAEAPREGSTARLLRELVALTPRRIDEHGDHATAYVRTVHRVTGCPLPFGASQAGPSPPQLSSDYLVLPLHRDPAGWRVILPYLGWTRARLARLERANAALEQVAASIRAGAYSDAGKALDARSRAVRVGSIEVAS